MSPSGSPKPKHAPAPLIISPSTAITDGRVPDGHPLSPIEINHLTVSPAPVGPSKPAEKRMSLEPTSSRTPKKRLSFASITSFFNVRNADAMAASNKKKQQRSSSVPNDRVSAQAAAAAAESLIKATESETSPGATTMSKIQGVFGMQNKKNKIKKVTSHSENAPTTTIISSAKPLRSALTHRSVRAPSVRKVQVVNRHQGSISNSGRRLQHHQSEPLINLSHEPVVNNSSSGSRRNSEEHSRTGPTRHCRQSSIAGRQASQQGHYPQIDRKQRLSVRYSSSEEYDVVHHSDLYTLDQHQQQQQQHQFQYHGGYVQYDSSTAPQTPRVNPVSTKPMTPQTNDPSNYSQVNISPCTSRGAVAEGSFTFSPTGSRQRDSYISCSSNSPSKDTSPKLASASTPRQQQNCSGTAATVVAAIDNPHRRSSYDATTNNRRSSYEDNSRRNSVVVTSSISSPPATNSAPVARLSVDHTLMSDHPCPSSPSAYPQAIAANGNHQHAIFANHQQQQQLQLQQQLHYQQFQRTQQQYQQQQQQQQLQQQHHHHHQMQYAPDHHHYHHHYQQQQQQQQQQFMNPHAGTQVFHEQYHIQPQQSQIQQYPQQQQQQQQQQQSYQYPPYPYQYNMQQPLPSHLYYTSVQHPALAYPGVSSTNSIPPPPLLQYSIGKSSGSGSGSGSGGNPSPTPWSSISPSPSPSTPPRPSRQLHFSTAQPTIHETWMPEQYDRTSDPNITAHRLTPAIAQRIKLELNQFKSQEMLVHQESRVNTHFFA
ncbi:hypothetical protein BGZ89_004989 [Linnemannia elongata]|nr:hypothetical protein BGZ89_004989 [Linnemannia elongata]